ncbi:MAG: HD domain-containing protein [Bryobacteraceae bacterium]
MWTPDGAREELLRRSDEVDQMVATAFRNIRPPVTVVAVGGYGRRELFPYSDVDLLLLNAAPDETKEQRELIAEFLRALWDAGLRVSQSVHTVEDCLELHQGNLELTISVLDHRFLCGDRARHGRLAAELPKFLHRERAVLMDQLCKMTRARRAKFADTIYHLEPNVKEHPGALRDLHVIRWLAVLREAPADYTPETAAAFLYSIRLFLHRSMGRDANLLTFDLQEAISPEAAVWMREYYRGAREIWRAANQAMEASERRDLGLFSQFRDWRGRVSNSEFTVSRERVLLREPLELERDPEYPIRLLQFLARHKLALARETESRITAALGGMWVDRQPSWPSLRALLALPWAATALRVMHDTGLLTRLIPEWTRIDCLVTRDFYHQYTVDEHTLVTLEALEELRDSKDEERQRFRTLLHETAAWETLRLALLLHDMGKGGGTGEHTGESVRLAAVVMERLGVPPGERETVLFLIRHHLDLSGIMNSRDLSDPGTALFIAERIGTVERLRMLTLLTWADISAVNPSAMTPWRLEQLWLTYLAGYDEFTRELHTSRIREPRLTAEVSAFIEGFPTRYLNTHSEDDIRAHYILWSENKAAGLAISIERSEGTWRMTVITGDRPFLLASLSGTLAAFGLNILKAEAFSNSQGIILDTFAFADPHRTLELNASEVDRLRDTVRRAITGKVDVRKLLAGRRKPAITNGAHIPASVAFNNDASETSSLIEIVAVDRPGLLYDMTQVLSSAGLNIEVVLIDTEAHKAMDVFYVTFEGARVPLAMQPEIRKKLLEVCG